MREFRMGAKTTEHYSSFEDCAKSWGCRSVVKRTRDMKKLASQQEKFNNSHKCKVCGNTMRWVNGTSTMVCSNDKCNGFKHIRTDADGNKIVTYTPSYTLLNDRSFDICNNIFS